jgi:hypothetical protein
MQPATSPLIPSLRVMGKPLGQLARLAPARQETRVPLAAVAGVKPAVHLQTPSESAVALATQLTCRRVSAMRRAALALSELVRWFGTLQLLLQHGLN